MSMTEREFEILSLLTGIVVQDLVNSGVKEKVFTIRLNEHTQDHFAIGIIERDSTEIKIKASLFKDTNEPESTRNVPKGYH